MIIETKTRKAKTWKRTNVQVTVSKAPRRLELKVFDQKVLDGAHHRLWRVQGVEYETRATNIPARKVYVCEVQ